MQQPAKPLTPRWRLTDPLVVATSNAAKLVELKAILGASRQLTLIAQAELNIAPAAETGQSFVENAIAKARHAAAASGLAAIADDSGLSVEALGGQPGVYSARYAGESASAADNNAKLLQQLAALPDSGGVRTAALVCVLVLMRNAHDPAPLIAEGCWHGRVLATPTATHAARRPFGYDAVFEVLGRGCSAAQLCLAEKNRVSHRGQAMRQLLQRLSEL